MPVTAWPLILLGLRIVVVGALYLFVIAALRALRAELRARTTPITATARASRAAAVAMPEAAPMAEPEDRRADRLEVIAYEGDDGLADETLVGRTYLLDGPAVVGRGGSSTIMLPDRHVSSRHARLLPDAGDWWVEDLESTNGTYVGTRRVRRRTRLDPSSEVRFGPVVARLVRGRRR